MNPAPVANIPIVNTDGTMQDAFRLFINQVSRESIIIGTGSPEGVVLASQGQEFMDDAGTAGNIKYIKRDSDIGGDKTQGWVLI